MYIDRSIRKHGSENFIFDLIETCETQDEVNEFEVFWIAYLQTRFSLGS